MLCIQATDERDRSQIDVQSFTSVPDVQAPSRLSLSFSREERSPRAGQQQQPRVNQPPPILTDALPKSSRQSHAPTIIIQPSTPDDTVTQLLSTQTHPPDNSQMSRASPTSLLVSPSSWSANTIPSSPVTTRKQRITMGPRADCEKCLQGVKGHRMHLD
jgi:hypothetical protein